MGGLPLLSSRRRRVTCSDLSPPLQDTTPTGLQSPGRGTKPEQRVFVPGSRGAGDGLASISPFLSVPGVLEVQRCSFPRWGPFLHDPRAQVRARCPGHRVLFQGLRRDPGGVWGYRCRRRKGPREGRRQIQSADHGLLWPLLRGWGIAAAILPSSLSGPILCTPGPPPLPSSRSR